MRVFSAAEAIAPAISRTRQFLFQPFRLGTFLKLSLVAVVTEGMTGNMGSGNFDHRNPGAISPPNFPGAWLGVAILVIAISIPLAILAAYLVMRLRFAFFHCLVYQVKLIAPGWRLYREQAMRFFLLSIGVGFAFLAVIVLCALPFISGFIRLFRDMHQGAHFDFGGFFALFLPFVLILLVLGLLGWATDVFLHDLMLPHMALENATVGEAWDSASARVGAEPGAFLLYAFLRFVLPIFAMLAVTIVLAIPMIVIGLAFAAVIAGLNAVMGDAAGFEKLLLVIVETFTTLIGVGIAVFVGLFVCGPVATALRTYALMFYGGRYQVLGDLLFPPVPPQPPAAVTGAPVRS